MYEGDRKTRVINNYLAHNAKTDVIIALAFPPEAFHVTRAQDLGQLVKTEGARLFLRGVPPAQLSVFAREYWVVSVERWDVAK